MKATDQAFGQDQGQVRQWILLTVVDDKNPIAGSGLGLEESGGNFSSTKILDIGKMLN